MASVVRLPEHAGGGRVEQVAVGPERRSLSLHFVAFLTDLRAVLASSAVVHCADAHVAAPATSPPASRVSLRMRVPPGKTLPRPVYAVNEKSAGDPGVDVRVEVGMVPEQSDRMIDRDGHVVLERR